MQLAGKLKIAREYLGKKQTEMATLVGIGQSTWQVYELGNSVPGGKVFGKLAELGFNINWFFTDNAPMLLSETAGESEIKSIMEAAAQVDADAINIQELLNMTAEVLISGTVYRPALAANIKAFHRSIALEHDNREMHTRITTLENQIQQIEERLRITESQAQGKKAAG